MADSVATEEAAIDEPRVVKENASDVTAESAVETASDNGSDSSEPRLV
jgi:hypothetical protein